MNLKNGTFCVLPFISDHQGTNGVRSFCCYSGRPVPDLSSPEYQDLLKKIWEGTKVIQCSKCYQLEDQKVISPRQKETFRWLQDNEVADYIKNWLPNSELKIFFYDIRIDNKCNLACISCGPGASSLWAKELGITMPPPKSNWDKNKILLAKKIYFAGGEPFLIPRIEHLLKEVSERTDQPEVVINTNLTKINDKIKTVLSKIKKLTLVVSVDSYGPVNEYHRWPMSWNKFLNNLEWAISIGCFVQFNTVVDAVSIFNCSELQQFENKIQDWTLADLDWPTALLVNNLPDNLKSVAHENFSKIKNSKSYQTNLQFRSKTDNILRKILAPGDTNLLSEYITQIDKRRNIDHRQYLGVTLT